MQTCQDGTPATSPAPTVDFRQSFREILLSLRVKRVRRDRPLDDGWQDNCQEMRKEGSFLKVAQTDIKEK